MSGIQGSDLISLGAAPPDLAPTPFLYSHLKIDEGSGTTLLDSSGNGHHLNWNTAGANATPPAGHRQIDHLIWLAGALHDSWNASTPQEYPFEISAYTSIYAITFTLNVLLTANCALFCARGTTGGSADAGYQLQISSTEIPTIIFHNGTTTIGSKGPGTALTVGERTTALFCFDAITQKPVVALASDTTSYVQHLYEEGTALTDAITETGTSIPCLGQRAADQSSEGANWVSIYNCRFYHDFSGGPLPANLGDIARWMHQNPTSNIPAAWWS